MHAREVRRLLDRDHPIHGDRVVVFHAPGTGQVAFVAGRRVGGAVDRNRARRVLRAAWRDLVAETGTRNDVVLVARRAIRGAKTKDLVTELSRSLRPLETKPS